MLTPQISKPELRIQNASAANPNRLLQAQVAFSKIRTKLRLGRLIEELGFKNFTVGRARVSEVHGNFIVNDGGATAEEILTLIEEIKAAAARERGINLETEVQIVGVDA